MTAAELMYMQTTHTRTEADDDGRKYGSHMV